MKAQALNKLKLPARPGVYFFVGTGNKILYIGKATSLRDRVRSYFSKDIVGTRGEHIKRMVDAARTVRFETTDSVLEALVLEAFLIKKHQPKYNTDEKDDKSFNHVVITKEDFPRVLIVRGRDLDSKLQAKSLPRSEFGSTNRGYKLKAVYGPFPRGGELREAVKLIRKIFPFRDKCAPCILPRSSASRPRNSAGCKPCFNRQIGLCPGVCSGEISKKEYAKQIRNLNLFFSGKKNALVVNLKREMKASVKELRFEHASELKRELFALNHIQDVALMKREPAYRAKGEVFRIEAYDAAHLGGGNSVAVMTVTEDGVVNKNEYRKFKLKLAKSADDLASLEEVLRRRFNHLEWRTPNIVVVDGGMNQKRRAENVLIDMEISVPVLSVVKNEFHKPRAILGEAKTMRGIEREILLANSEAHRFAIKYHRELRDRIRK